MPEHRIRLRGAWDRLDPADPLRTARVDLPVVWAGTDLSRPFRLVRRFGRPKFDPDTEVIELQMADVPGMTSIRLNGKTIATGGGAIIRIAIIRIAVHAQLATRNTLEVDVDPAGVVPGLPWGTIALVIVGRPG